MANLRKTLGDSGQTTSMGAIGQGNVSLRWLVGMLSFLAAVVFSGMWVFSVKVGILLQPATLFSLSIGFLVVYL